MYKCVQKIANSGRNGKNMNSLNLVRNHAGKRGKNANGGQQQIVGIYTYNIDKCWQWRFNAPPGGHGSRHEELLFVSSSEFGFLSPQSFAFICLLIKLCDNTELWRRRDGAGAWRKVYRQQILILHLACRAVSLSSSI